jgi:hypothetical protein
MDGSFANGDKTQVLMRALCFLSVFFMPKTGRRVCGFIFKSSNLNCPLIASPLFVLKRERQQSKSVISEMSARMQLEVRS